jgi:hypothetical protein
MENHGLVPATPPEATDIDENGHDLADYRWVPVLRKRRADGWSPQKQREFIEALADSGSVSQAARSVGMSLTSCYRLRRGADAQAFAAAWDAAVGQAARQLIDVALDRALHGTEQAIFDKDGRRIATQMRYNDRLLMFLLRANFPDRFRHAIRDQRRADEPALPEPVPVMQAIAALEPAPPADPHLLMPPDQLATALMCADLANGELPHFHRDPPVEFASGPSVLEAMLEEARRGDVAQPEPCRRRTRKA